MNPVAVFPCRSPDMNGERMEGCSLPLNPVPKPGIQQLACLWKHLRGRPNITEASIQNALIHRNYCVAKNPSLLKPIWSFLQHRSGSRYGRHLAAGIADAAAPSL